MPIQEFHELIEKLKNYHPSEDFELVYKAYYLAKEAHGDQRRRSGKLYITHPIAVASILADLEMDKETIIAGLLHDVVEDTHYTVEEIEKAFNPEIAALVDGVTKLSQIPYSASKEEIQVENYRKMFLAMAKDIRVILIKLADRLHNLQTLVYMPPHKQLEKAEESLNIYAPLAHRLGISKIKLEMEDLSLKYLEPEAYQDIKAKVNKKKEEREAFIEKIVENVSNQLGQVDIKAEVFGRPKHYFSIYKKMVSQGKTFDQIYDLFAIRVIVDTIKDCYGVFGIVHEMYKPVPGRFKDYIAMPKPNRYQSLHTTLIGPRGEPFEIQIRTREMHRVAEYGIAAHWKYKEGKADIGKEELAEKKLNWLRQILEWQRDISDNKEFMDALKTDLDAFNDQVYAFTPKGDVFNLPLGSTPIDFAYEIHSAVGNKMVGARVNGRIVTFDYQIQNGDRIEIMISQNSRGPSRDWLKIAKSSQAKNKINSWYRKQYKNENIIKGRELLERYAKNKGLDYKKLTEPKYQEAAYRKYGFKNWEAVCAAVGHGGLKEGQVLNRLQMAYEKTHKQERKPEEIIQETVEKIRSSSTKRSKSGIIVKGINDLAVRFSKCCTPVPGDEIVGFVTRGRGLSIHRTDCGNMLNLTAEERQRMLDAEWEGGSLADDRRYKVDIKVYGANRNGLITDISRVLTDATIPLISFSAKSLGDNHSITDITMEIKSQEQLQMILKRLQALQGVSEIQRANN